jgi:hypothetical protein
MYVALLAPVEIVRNSLDRADSTRLNLDFCINIERRLFAIKQNSNKVQGKANFLSCYFVWFCGLCFQRT